jgi:HSP20 family protein
MALIRSNNGFYSAIPSLINSLLTNHSADWDNSDYVAQRSTLPAVNISENDDAFFVEVAAPGLKKEDFKVKLENDTLTISSERKQEGVNGNEKYSKREFSYQSFNRTFTLAENSVDGDKIKAAYTDGILKIALPKREEVKPKPAREIQIA